eukprot:Clim_evm8s237 gene=Clim_evmTU8s237
MLRLATGILRTSPLNSGQRNISTTRVFRGKYLQPLITVRNVLNGTGIQTGHDVTIKGWVRSVRKQKRVGFCMVDDGSSIDGLQAVSDDPGAHFNHISTGDAIEVTGLVQLSPKGIAELVIKDLKCVGRAVDNYPLQKKRHTLEYLRTMPEARLRSRYLSAMTRIRDTVFHTCHETLRSSNYLQIHTPALTSNDCEGAGEQFIVDYPISMGPGSLTQNNSGDADSTAKLTVSGQLHLEVASNSHRRVYTMSPAFRAERSDTSRHLAEFHMLEIEEAFVNDLRQLQGTAIEVVGAACGAVAQTHAEELAVMHEIANQNYPDMDPVHYDEHLSLLQGIANWKFEGEVDLQPGNHRLPVIDYGDAVVLLQKSGHFPRFKFEDGLGSSEEAWLVEHYFGGGLGIVERFPISCKPWYMLRSGTHNERTESFDLLVPRVGELIGGSLREHRYDILMKQVTSEQMRSDLSWYMRLREYGCPPHGGWGLGMERLIMFVAGCRNIRDTLPFPIARLDGMVA